MNWRKTSIHGEARPRKIKKSLQRPASNDQARRNVYTIGLSVYGHAWKPSPVKYDYPPIGGRPGLIAYFLHTARGLKKPQKNPQKTQNDIKQKYNLLYFILALCNT